jgi:hypothetical protein
MKLHLGFISNSSSTSFLIFYNTKDQCKCCNRKDLNLEDLMLNYDGPDNKIYTTDWIEAIKQLNDFDNLNKEEKQIIIDWIVNITDIYNTQYFLFARISWYNNDNGFQIAMNNLINSGNAKAYNLTDKKEIKRYENS